MSGHLGRWMLSQRATTIGLAFLFVVAFATVVAPAFGLPDPNRQQLVDRLQPPLSTSSATGGFHALGTDQLGRDVLSRVLAGGRSSLSVAIPSVFIALFIGSGLGIVGAYRGGMMDAFVQRVAEIQLAFPFLLLALLLVAVLGRGIPTLIIAFAVSDWALFARTSRSEAMLVRNLPYVESAQAIGASHWRIVLSDILPNASTSALVLATLNTGKIMVAEASLSFLGLGVPPEIASWGSIVADGRGYLSSAWWISVAPGLVLLLVVLALIRVGDGLRELSDPMLGERRS